MSAPLFIESIVIGGLLLCLIGVFSAAWLDTIPPKDAKGYVRIRFSVFSKLYAVCPDNYQLEDGKVYYPATKQYLYFSYLGWLRYCFFSFMHKRQSSIASRKKGYTHLSRIGACRYRSAKRKSRPRYTRGRMEKHMNLYFQHSNGEYTLVSAEATKENALDLIYAHIESLNPDFVVYYVRSWDNINGTKYDVGSWSEFYLLTNKTPEELI